MGVNESKPQGRDWLSNTSGLDSGCCCCRQDASSGGASLIRIAHEPGRPRGEKTAFKMTVNRRLSTMATRTDSESPVDKLEELVDLHREGSTHFAMILLSCIDASDISLQSAIVPLLAHADDDAHNAQERSQMRSSSLPRCKCCSCMLHANGSSLAEI